DMDRAEEVVRRFISSEDPWARVLGARRDAAGAGVDRTTLRAALADLPCDFRFGANGPAIPADEALRSRLCNESVYIVRKGARRPGLDHRSTANAQGEEYLPDGIGAILRAAGEAAPRFTAGWLPTERPDEVMAYNNPEELLAIEDRLQGQRRRA